MPESADTTILEVVSDIAQIPSEGWNACAGSGDPFVRHAFLKALEASGSAVAKRGWLPQHLVLRGDNGGVLGAVPLYLKGHSYGEYVFDWAWADAYERAGGAYYPKLQSAVPFTPVTGPRLLIRSDLPPRKQAHVADTLIAGLIRAVQEHHVSSLHVTFPRESEWNRLGEHGFLRRLGIQYHFENPGYRDFHDFLDALSSRKRKQIRRERREVVESGVTIRRLTGADIQPGHWEAFYDFYLATADKRWGFPYLTPEFFEEIGETMAERILLVMAEDAAGRPVAGALNLIGSEALYGRNWGCLDDHRFLHFEACYYQAIEYAIEAGLKRVEAGAQGEHKIQRGYLPVLTHSAHWIADPALERGVADFLERERPAVRAQLAALMEHSPYRAPDYG
ncbi:GNAT family N-acetyltransferase [Ferruginivarius sediminum]|uniref:N-acetyltransferase n=1 Tax=Ferruginivarius sediminum TaxID=2661937 RepID=A0A369TIX6_9PROT|nr:GNAT family N-acetyltransferase [Ferruginivarius sediminum]RDD62836.1 N-acetyltransferase [Ferruginivarius sediminum]